jgi:hypothetical protein
MKQPKDRVYVCVYIYVCIHTRIYIRIYILYIRIYIRTYINTCIQKQTQTQTQTQKDIYLPRRQLAIKQLKTVPKGTAPLVITAIIEGGHCRNKIKDKIK